MDAGNLLFISRVQPAFRSLLWTHAPLLRGAHGASAKREARMIWSIIQEKGVAKVSVKRLNVGGKVN